MKRIIIHLAFTILVFSHMYSICSAIEYSGKIVNDIGRPAADATITIKNLADPDITFSSVTDTTGTFTFVMTNVEERGAFPFKLYGNFPNPFNPQTRISYSLDKASEVKITVFNILGQQVRILNQGFREPGFYTVLWDGKTDSGRTNSAGIYLYKLDAGERFLTSKMLMVDASTGSWISARNVPLNTFTENQDILYLLMITHPDAEMLSLGPMTINATTDTVLTIKRILSKMQLVHGNTYFRGTERREYPALLPLHRVKITRDFLMDKYEVPVVLFCDVMNHALSRGAISVVERTVKNVEGDSKELFGVDMPGSEINTSIEYSGGILSPREGFEKVPISYVSWYGAMFYCYERNVIEGFPQAIDITDWSCDFKSTGYRLPTDSEWELAAKWIDGRDYAFGPDPGHYKPMNTQLNDDGFDDSLSPVGWFSPQGDSHDGISDLSGNIYEWVWDWQGFYESSWVDSVLVDPTGPPSGINKICRGGSAYGCFRAARTFDKANIRIGDILQAIGFRTIRTLKY